MEFTIVDGAVAVITVISGLLAYSRGLTREVFAIGGWLLAALIAFYLSPVVEPLIRELPGVGKFLATSCVISMVAAFTLIVALSLMVLSVFTPLFSAAVLESPLAPIDRGLGFVFGIVRGVVLIAIGYLIYANLSGDVAWPPLDNAASKAIFDDTARLIQDNLPQSAADWFGGRIDALMANCGGDAATSAGQLPDLGTGTAPAATGTGAETATPTGTGAGTGAGTEIGTQN